MVKLKFLQFKRVTATFRAHSQSAAEDWEQRVQGMGKLTPGDFSVAARQFDVMDIEVSPGELFRQLQEECKIKGGGSAKIGFVL